MLSPPYSYVLRWILFQTKFNLTLWSERFHLAHSLKLSKGPALGLDPYTLYGSGVWSAFAEHLGKSFCCSFLPRKFIFPMPTLYRRPNQCIRSQDHLEIHFKTSLLL